MGLNSLKRTVGRMIKNDFKCMICDEAASVGIFVEVQSDELKDYDVKICLNKECAEKAKLGIFSKDHPEKAKLIKSNSST
jgi:hypothetical protein